MKTGAAVAAPAAAKSPSKARKRTSSSTPSSSARTPPPNKSTPTKPSSTAKGAGARSKTAPKDFTPDQSRAVFDAVQILTIQCPQGASRKALASALAEGDLPVPTAALTACLDDHEREGMIFTDAETGLFQAAI
jgi:hypothetical protein